MKTQKIDKTQDLPMMISDAAWQSIHPFLKTLRNVYVGNPEDCRRFLSAIVWIRKQGATWRALPKVYGYWNTIYRRFGRWCDAGVIEYIFGNLFSTGETSMRIDLGAKKVAVNRISRVVTIDSYTARIHFIFGNAIKVRCCSSEFVDKPTYRSIFHFDGTPAEFQRLKSKA